MICAQRYRARLRTRTIHGDKLRSSQIVCTHQPLGQRSNCCRSRKSIRGRISMYNLHPVYIQYFLLVLSQLCFTSTARNKDQQKEQLFCSPVVLVLYLGDVHELRSSCLAARAFHTRRKTPHGKSGTNWFSWTDFHDSGTNL